MMRVLVSITLRPHHPSAPLSGSVASSTRPPLLVARVHQRVVQAPARSATSFRSAHRVDFTVKVFLVGDKHPNRPVVEIPEGRASSKAAGRLSVRAHSRHRYCRFVAVQR